MVRRNSLFASQGVVIQDEGSVGIDSDILFGPNGIDGTSIIDGTVSSAAIGDPSNLEIIPAGTKQIFVQTAAPTGWTKDTTHNDKAMRVVSGSVSSGGSDAFTTTFGSGKTTAGTTLGLAQIPIHSHNLTTDFYNGGGTTGKVAHGAASNTQETVATSTRGGNGSHSHNLSGFDLQYVDVIIATKD